MSLVDLSGVKENQGFAPVPKGEYALVIDEAEVKETRDGEGRYIKIKCRIIEPEEFEGRFIWHNFNIKNKSAEAQKIGLGQLKHFLRVSGHKNPEVLETVLDMVGAKVKANIKIKLDEQYGDKNEVTTFKEYAKTEKAPAAPKAGTPF
jgi:hypothetical protein